MAVRHTNEFISVLLLPDTQKVRVTNEFISVLLLPNTQKARISNEFVSILFQESSNPNVSDTLANWAESLILGIGLIFSDNLNNWGDTASVVIPAGVSQSFSATLNNWADALAYDYLISTVPLAITKADRVARWPVDAPNTFPALRDGGVNLVASPSGPLGINAASLDTYNEDDVRLDIGLIFSDDINNLSDSGVIAYGLTAVAFDTLFYDFVDSFAHSFVQQLTASASDSFTLTDSLVFSNYENPIPPLDDTLILSDGLNILLRHLLNPADQLTLTDSLTNLYQYRREFADTIENFNDAASNNFGNVATITVGDSMFNLSDATSRLMNTSDTIYLRRYLNDVVN